MLKLGELGEVNLVILYSRYAYSVLASLEPRRSTRISKVCLASPSNFGHLYDFFKDLFQEGHMHNVQNNLINEYSIVKD